MVLTKEVAINYFRGKNYVKLFVVGYVTYPGVVIIDLTGNRI